MGRVRGGAGGGGGPCVRVDDLFGMSPVAVVPMAGARAGVWPLAGRHEEKRGGSRPYTMARRRCPTVMLYIFNVRPTTTSSARFCRCRSAAPLPMVGGGSCSKQRTPG